MSELTGGGPTYSDLIRERADNPCTPEEQAGPDARVCATCGRRTIHQICTDYCTACSAKREALPEESDHAAK